MRDLYWLTDEQMAHRTASSLRVKKRKRAVARKAA